VGNLIEANLVYQQVDRLQPLPTVAIRVIDLMGNENHDIRELASILSLDAALTMRVMSAANSVANVRRTRVTSISQAITLLGEQPVAGIALAASSPVLFRSELDGYEAGAGALWAHSLRTALAAREIARRSKIHLSLDEVFTAGIIHDIGKSVINEFLARHRNEIEIDLRESKECEFTRIEQELIGANHATVGAAMAGRWNIPEKLTNAISFHHSPFNAPVDEHPFVFAIHIGDLLAMALGDGTGLDTLAHLLDERYSRYYDLTHSTIEAILSVTQGEFSDANSLLA